MDLKEMVGDKYVVTLDESWDAETPENRAEFEAAGELWWYYEIKGDHGTIYPFNESVFIARMSRRTGKKALALLDSAAIIEDNIEAISLKAEVRHLRTILRLIKPARVHQLTPEQREILTARLAANRFRKAKKITENDPSGTLPGPIPSAGIPTLAGGH